MYPGQMYPLPQSNLVVQSPTKTVKLDPFPLPQSNLVVQSPTTLVSLTPFPLINQT